MYVVGRPFRSNIGNHKTGDKLETEVVHSWRTWRSLVSGRFLFDVSDPKSLKKLPSRLQRMADKNEQALKVKNSSNTAEWEKPEALKQAEREKDALLRHRLKGNESHRERIARRKKAKENEPHEPVQPPEREIKTDKRKDEAEKRGSEFDPEAIRVMKLEDLREMAEERGLPKSRNKPELAQSIIDNEIEKLRTKTEEETKAEEETKK